MTNAHQVPDEGAMVDRPFGEGEARHNPAIACIRRTFWAAGVLPRDESPRHACASPSPTPTQKRHGSGRWGCCLLHRAVLSTSQTAGGPLSGNSAVPGIVMLATW